MGLLSNLSTRRLNPERFRGFGANLRQEKYVGDLNNITENSLYNYNSAEVTSDHESVISSWGFVWTQVHTNSPSHITQLSWPMNTDSGRLFMRQKIDNAWGSWEEVGGSASGDTVVSEGSNPNGNYRIWSSGLIEQWGSNQTGTNTASSLRSFPIPFTTEVQSVVATQFNTRKWNYGAETWVNPSTNLTQYTIEISGNDGTHQDNRPYFWHAIGK